MRVSFCDCEWQCNSEFPNLLMLLNMQSSVTDIPKDEIRLLMDQELKFGKNINTINEDKKWKM